MVPRCPPVKDCTAYPVLPTAHDFCQLSRLDTSSNVFSGSTHTHRAEPLRDGMKRETCRRLVDHLRGNGKGVVAPNPPPGLDCLPPWALPCFRFRFCAFLGHVFRLGGCHANVPCRQERGPAESDTWNGGRHGRQGYHTGQAFGGPNMRT